MVGLDDGMWDRFVGLVLGHAGREYPGKLDHVINGSEEVRSPRELHPVSELCTSQNQTGHGHLDGLT